MAYAPYTPEELAELRKTASKTQLWPVAHKLLATLASVESERQFQQARADGFEELLVQAMAERDDAQADLAQLRQAAQALVAELERTSGDWPRFCDEPRCCCLAMHDDGDQVACDEHQGMLVDGDVEDLSYAPALRALRAALKEEP